MKRPVWAEIDLNALGSNVREIRRVTNEKAQVMAIVKANGYGHGVVPVSRVALRNGASWIGVALLQEAILLRERGISAPILVLGYTPVHDIADVIRYDISQTVFTWEDALAIASVAHNKGKKAKVHVKIDTGMGRLGFKCDRETLDIICRLAHLPGIEVEGSTLISQQQMRLIKHLPKSSSPGSNSSSSSWQRAMFLSDGGTVPILLRFWTCPSPIWIWCGLVLPSMVFILHHMSATN